LVSVVIPSYNRGDYIVETIESVLQQSYDPIEIIVIDDGSKDNTREVVDRFLPRVRYVWQENAERGAARNHGLRLAKGEFIAFLDSDDLWLPEMVERCVAFLRANPGTDLVYTDAMQIDALARELRVLRAGPPSSNPTDRLLKSSFLSIGRHLVRTEAVRKIGGFREERELSGSEDWEMWVRLSLEARIGYLPVVTTKIRTHPGNTMTNAAGMERSMARAADLFERSPAIRSTHLTSLRRMRANMALVNAINYCSQEESRKSLRFLAKAASGDPHVVLDPRFSYTIARLLKGKVGL
jgi:glycosyltransferase involved in cell wall biosynthesis